jgi:hypothetical protein
MNRIAIRAGRGRLPRSRKNATWWLSEPFSDLADAQEVDRLGGQLAALRAREFIRGGADLAAQGLSPSLFHVAVTDAKGTTVAVDFGATRSDGNAVYAQRDGQVLVVEREIVDDLSKEAVAFRSTRLADFNRTDVTALEGVFRKATFALSQKDGGWTSEGSILAPAVDDVESAVLDAQSKGFLDEAEAKALGAPDATVTVKTKTQTWVLTIHPRSDGAAAKVSGRTGAFAVEPALAGQLQDAFRKAASPPPTPAPTKATPSKLNVDVLFRGSVFRGRRQGGGRSGARSAAASTRARRPLLALSSFSSAMVFFSLAFEKVVEERKRLSGGAFARRAWRTGFVFLRSPR